MAILFAPEALQLGRGNGQCGARASIAIDGSERRLRVELCRWREGPRTAGCGASPSLPAVPAKVRSRSDLPTFVIVYCQSVVYGTFFSGRYCNVRPIINAQDQLAAALSFSTACRGFSSMTRNRSTLRPAFAQAAQLCFVL